jgi:hypothetical protein
MSKRVPNEWQYPLLNKIAPIEAIRVKSNKK